MKKSLLITVVLLVASSTLSMTQLPRSEVLTDEDYRMQWRAFATHAPGLTALEGTPYWESYNQWLCFPAEAVEVTCLEAEDNGVVWIPALHAVHDGHYYEISMDPDPKPDCERIKSQWQELIRGERELCVYAAPLQELTSIPAESGVKDGSLWSINSLKSSKGYWNVVTGENSSSGDEDASTEIAVRLNHGD